MLIKVLRQKRAELYAEAQKIFDTAAKEGRGLTEAEAARDDKITDELKGIDADITRVERQMDRQRQMDAHGDGNSAADRTDAQRRGNGATFASLGEQMLAVARASMPNAQQDPRLVYSGPSGASEGIASDGGFLVQTDFVNDLLQNTYDSGEIAKRIRKIPVGPNSNGIRMNGVDETSRVNGSRWGGIQSFWTGEAVTLAGSQPKFRRITMELEKLTGLCYATDELLQDAVALESWMQQAFSDEFTFKVEDAVVNGTGAGMPLGLLNAGCVITVNKETSQVATTLVAENIMKMWARLPARSRQNAVWLCNQDIEPQLYQLNVKIKNVAGSENVGGIAIPAGVVFVPPGTNGNQYGTLMGRPVIPVEYCATLGTAGDIILADLSQYLGIDKGAIQSASSIHVRFLFDETAFRFVYRFNGQPLWAKALTPYKGANTLAPFVICQTR